MKSNNQITKIPITIALAYHSLFINKDDINPCLKDFIQYIRQYGKNISKQSAASLNSKTFKQQYTYNQKRDLVQICNLQLQTYQDVGEIFPNIVKSKNIPRQQLESLLEDIRSKK